MDAMARGRRPRNVFMAYLPTMFYYVLRAVRQHYFWNDMEVAFNSAWDEWIYPRHCEMPIYHMNTIAWPEVAGSSSCVSLCLARLHEHFEGLASSPELCQVLNTESEFDWLYTDFSSAQMPAFHFGGLDSKPLCICKMNLIMHRQRMVSVVPEQCTVEAVAKRLSFWGWMVQSVTSGDPKDCAKTTWMTPEQLATFYVGMKYNISKQGEVARWPYGPPRPLKPT
ncbi:hypothetical protein BCR37DRAFT_193483 [Protomyces lactucae-debilis]|uniref:Uncharacterized protein n=1 Tax=Protomyces lactucae-debilis TaxID=2754530 RepID=A0A1Y2EUA0_PROLT|nr:uncharacterized protein BCR37DRAFT_193483 [Protomyces lactucae-debilis]ORY75109.1 hypothetical protein BCR37DRAFT_193483 [Protomyces lactucae-debilis]